MKRTGFKRPAKALKRPVAKSKRTKATPIKKLRKQLWELCKQITRLTYGNTCYTCDAKELTGSNWHTGHFIPRSICGLYLRFDLRDLRPQCYRCNISLAGNGSEFYRRLVEREGQEYVDQIFADKKRETKETVAFYQEKIAQYTALLCTLEKKELG